MTSEAREVGTGELIRLSAVICLVSGLGQNLARVLAAVTGKAVWNHGHHALWMTPAGDALFYAALLLLVIPVRTVIPALRRTVATWAVLTFPLFLTALLLVPQLHLWAQLLVAAGLAVRVGTWVAASPARSGRLVRWGLPRFAVLTIVLAVPLAAWPIVQEWRISSALPPARDGAPNVLLLIWDTVRARSLDLYGGAMKTAPNLTAFASTGMVFDRAISTASYTLPSHASIFTGRWANDLSTDWRTPLDKEPRTLAEALDEAGYRTGGFSANRFFVFRAFGITRGFAHFEEFRLGLENAVRSSTLVRWIWDSNLVRDLTGIDDHLARVSARASHEQLVRWLERDRSRPYFAFVNLMEAHGPYLPNPPWDHAFGWYAEDAPPEVRRAARREARHGTEAIDPKEATRQLPAYEGAIAELDAETAAMLDDLRERGLLDNTIIVIAADHGEEFGEHGFFGHGNTLYFDALHVPLVVVYPGHVPPGRVASTVSTRQIGATILDLAGLPDELPGGSLRGLWEEASIAIGPVLSTIRSDPNLPAGVPAHAGDLTSVIDDSLQVITNSGAATEAFRLIGMVPGTSPADTLAAAAATLRRTIPGEPPRMR